MSISESSIPTTVCDARSARDLWFNRARAYQRHDQDCRDCKWGFGCPAEDSLNALCAEAWDSLEIELDEERPARALALLVCAVVMAVGVVAAWLAVLWVLGKVGL